MGINVIEISKYDTLVLHFDKKLTKEERQYIAYQFNEIIGCSVVVLDNVVEKTIIKIKEENYRIEEAK